MPVGGVRIEDDILITSESYENLTTAPKGDEMLEIIRTGSSNDTLYTKHRRSPYKTDEEQPPLRYAPGISTETPGQVSKPLKRAATMPAEFSQSSPVDFEPFDGPSLFSNFKRSMTTDERVEYWRKNRERATPSKNHLTTYPTLGSLCGTLSSNVRHVHMSFAGTPRTGNEDCTTGSDKPICPKCNILRETLSRLRQNLSASENDTSKPRPGPTCITATRVENLRIPHLDRIAVKEQATESIAKSAHLARKERREQKEDSVGPKSSTLEVAIPPHKELVKGYFQSRAIEKAKMHIQQHGVPEGQNPQLYQRQLAKQYFEALSGNLAAATSCQPMLPLTQPAVKSQLGRIVQPDQSDRRSTDATVQPLAAASQMGMGHEPLSLRPRLAQVDPPSLPSNSNPRPVTVRDRTTPHFDVLACDKPTTLQVKRQPQTERTTVDSNTLQWNASVEKSERNVFDTQQLSSHNPPLTAEKKDQEEVARSDALAKLRKLMGQLAQCSYRLRTFSDDISTPEQPTSATNDSRPRRVLSPRERARLEEKRESLQVKRAATVSMIQQRYPGMLPGWVV
jgi:hypothetical protein